jgi:hypothetical protein
MADNYANHHCNLIGYKQGIKFRLMATLYEGNFMLSLRPQVSSPKSINEVKFSLRETLSGEFNFNRYNETKTNLTVLKAARQTMTQTSTMLILNINRYCCDYLTKHRSNL